MAELVEFEIPGAGRARCKARLYVPHGAPPPPRPMLVHYHGGGWMVGDLETHDSACRFLAAHSGVSVLSTTYRLAPEHPFPAAVEDAQAAFALGLRACRRARRRPGADRGRRRLGRRQHGRRGLHRDARRGRPAGRRCSC